jgi:methylmalonyl-CoA/ethylmalonyl-CoA epimerase
LLRLHHVGVLVADPAPIAHALDGLLGLPSTGVEHYGKELTIGFYPCGEALIEVITPQEPGGWNGRWLQRTGPSIQHVAFEVADLEAAVDELRQRDVPLLEPSPRPGAGGTTIAFLDPEATGQILIELVWDPSHQNRPAISADLISADLLAETGVNAEASRIGPAQGRGG